MSFGPVHEDGTPFGMGGDHCPDCGRDWKAPHDPDCRQFRQCEYPPGCDHDSAPGRRACRPHFILVSALLGGPEQSDAEIAWANAELASR